MIRAIILATLLLCGSVADAAAEVGSPASTVQADAADAAWLAYAPGPVTPGVVCLVDSGVDTNPDTDGIVIGSHALYPGTSTEDEMARLSPRVQPGNHPDGHGTLMAMLMAAPQNGWGMVGIAPTSVRVYNMKALQNGTTRFSDEKEAEAIEACVRLREGADPTLTVINLSLGSESSPEPATASEIDNEITAAKNQGLSVVAAAGNNDGALEFPASYPGVLAVGAENAADTGSLCSFSARGEGLDLLAPGCDTATGGLEGAFQDTGEPNVSMGTSQASSLTSALLASIRAYAPTLTAGQAEHCLTSTASGLAINAAAAFQACGLQNIVQAGTATQETDNATSTGSPSRTETNATSGLKYDINLCALGATCPPEAGTEQRSLGSFELRSCPTPHLLSIAGGAGELVRITVRPAEHCILQARVIRRDHKPRRLAIKRLARRTFVLNAPLGQKFEVRWISPAHDETSSRWITLKV